MRGADPVGGPLRRSSPRRSGLAAQHTDIHTPRGDVPWHWKKVLYTAHATATGGREGRAVTSNKALDVKRSTPRELGGPGGDGTNPEQLFAAGYAACFIGAMKAVAARETIALPADVSIDSSVGIGPIAGGAFGIQVAMQVKVPGMARADAEALVHKALQVCPYSNATRGNIDVDLSVAD